MDPPAYTHDSLVDRLIAKVKTLAEHGRASHVPAVATERALELVTVRIAHWKNTLTFRATEHAEKVGHCQQVMHALEEDLNAQSHGTVDNILLQRRRDLMQALAFGDRADKAILDILRSLIARCAENRPTSEAAAQHRHVEIQFVEPQLDYQAFAKVWPLMKRHQNDTLRNIALVVEEEEDQTREIDNAEFEKLYLAFVDIDHDVNILRGSPSWHLLEHHQTHSLAKPYTNQRLLTSRQAQRYNMDPEELAKQWQGAQW